MCWLKFSAATLCGFVRQHWPRWLSISLELFQVTKIIPLLERQSIQREGFCVCTLCTWCVFSHLFCLRWLQSDEMHMRSSKATNIPSVAHFLCVCVRLVLVLFCWRGAVDWFWCGASLYRIQRARGGCETRHRRIGLPILYFATLCHTYTSQSRNKVYRAPHRDGAGRKKLSWRLGKQSIKIYL